MVFRISGFSLLINEGKRNLLVIFFFGKIMVNFSEKILEFVEVFILFVGVLVIKIKVVRVLLKDKIVFLLLEFISVKFSVELF